ncbi:MAG: universal stress protein [Candidatus Rokubacteria bacterium]|nr:universal stress protein [Candidatus Rokubacteria bacterium]
MGTASPFHVLVATDGSSRARAALATAVAFPWPRGARASGVIARRGFAGPQIAGEWPVTVWEALDRSLDRVRAAARRALARRWPAAEVVLVDQPPVEAILAQARRRKAGVVVLGSRGHGLLSRMVLGSVSRGVVRRADCPVLVVKRRLDEVRRVLVGLDGSPNARRAVAFVARLAVPPGGQVTVLRVVEPIRVPSLGLAPASVRSAVGAQAEALNQQSIRAAEREVGEAAARLERRGWKVEAAVRRGVPLPELVRAVTAAGADLLVLGARGVGGVARLLLGSVAEGALGRAPVSVLVVK